MFTQDSLKRLLKLHEKTYGLFTWLNKSLKSGARSLAKVSEAMAYSEAAAHWLRANQSNLPADARPESDELEAFSHLFVSYLSTSYEVVDRSAVRACPGCWCCIYWIESKHLRPRDPDKKARAMAHDLKILYLRKLSEEAGLPFLDAELEKFIDQNRDAWPQLSLATYVAELERRSKFASQGEGVLALWREIAWKDGAANKKFQLKPELIIKAEAEIKSRLEKMAG